MRIKQTNQEKRLKHSERGKKYYQKNIEKIREYNKKRNHRAGHLKSSYGLTEQQWNELFTSQNFICAICGTNDAGGQRGWNTDHCHKTGKIRGILCIKCNGGLGMFRDNSELLRKALDYLLKTP